MADVQFNVTREPTVTVIALSMPPQVAMDEFDSLNTRMLEALATGTDGNWVIDLADSQYVGSAFLGMLVNIRQQIMTAAGRLLLCNLSPDLHEVIRTCMLERLFEITRSRPEALKRLGAA